MNGSLALALVLAAAGCHSTPAPAPAPAAAPPGAPRGNTAYVGPATPADAARPAAAPAQALADEANRSYDRADFDRARELALQVLDARPDDVRMMRLVVSAACILGDPAQARTYWARLPPRDQAQMTARCRRYGVTLP